TYRVASVDSDTQITLDRAYQEATAAGASYIVANLTSFVPYGGSAITALAAPWIVEAAGDRLCVVGRSNIIATPGTAPDVYLRRLYVSKGRDPDTGDLRLFTFDEADYHEFPANIVACAWLRDRMFVFTEAGT